MRTIRLERDGKPLLDIVSYGRLARESHGRLTPAQVEQIHRTVSRAPEVMVKVTCGGGGADSGGVKRHLSYINRKGELDIETDDGERLRGQGTALRLLTDWDLDLDQHRKRSNLVAADRRQAPKLIHRIIFSMPAGTPPEKVLSAVRVFAREEFGLKHRYAMVLHTDEPHPHVHLVIKAVSEEGVRLNIRKAILRGWRQEFARHLREQGIAANATERAVRGETKTTKRDGIYRAARRGASTYLQHRAEEAARCLAKGAVSAESGKATLLQTRRTVERGWRGVVQVLEDQGEQRLAESVSRFVAAMRPPRTEREALVEKLLEHLRRARASTSERVR